MHIEIWRGAGEEYYVRPRHATGTLRWYRQGMYWTSIRDTLPEDALEIELAALPVALQEELLAMAARAESMGDSFWSSSN